MKESCCCVNPPWFLITKQNADAPTSAVECLPAFTGDVDAQKLKALFQFAEPKGKPQLVVGIPSGYVKIAIENDQL